MEKKHDVLLSNIHSKSKVLHTMSPISLRHYNFSIYAWATECKLEPKKKKKDFIIQQPTILGRRTQLKINTTMSLNSKQICTPSRNKRNWMKLNIDRHTLQYTNRVHFSLS